MHKKCVAKICSALYKQSTLKTHTMSDSIEEKVKEIIVEQLGVEADKVTSQAKFIEDLGADSLDIVELVMAFEEAFEIEVPDTDAEGLHSVTDVVEYINKVKNA